MIMFTRRIKIYSHNYYYICTSITYMCILLHSYILYIRYELGNLAVFIILFTVSSSQKNTLWLNMDLWFYWSDGTKSNPSGYPFTYWQSNEPRFRDECVLMENVVRQWEEESCTDVLRYICEIANSTFWAFFSRYLSIREINLTCNSYNL